MACPSNSGRAETPTPRVVPLRGTQGHYRLTAVVAAEANRGVERLAQLYWGMQMLDPLNSDFDEDVLVAHFERHAPTAEVAAWALAMELDAVPDAELLQVEVGLANGSMPELVLRREDAPAGASGEVAA